MEGLVRGDVIILDFPSSNLIQAKRRPALIVKVPKGEDIIICQITAKSQEKSVEIPIMKKDFSKGELKRDSYVRIDKLTTIKKTRIRYRIGSLKNEKFEEILNEIIAFLKS